MRNDSLKEMPGGRPGSSLAIHRFLPYLVVLAVLIFTSAVRLRLAAIPLERDEGEFAYLGQLLLQGIPPYLTSYSMKPPGILSAYAACMAVFGETATGIHLGLAVVNAASIIVMFFLARRLLDTYAAAAASIAFAVVTLSQSVFGCFAHATHFVVFFTVSGFLLLLKALERERTVPFIASGVLFGIAYTMKQQGAFLIVFAALYLIFFLVLSKLPPDRRIRFAGAFLCGIATPLLLMLLLLSHAGVLEDFWFWTFRYPRELVATMDAATGLKNLSGQIAIMQTSLYPFLLIGALGIIALGLDRSPRMERLFIGGLPLFSFIAVCPGFYFTPHYFVLMAPPLALLVGGGVRFMTSLALFRGRSWVGPAVGGFFLLVAIGVFMGTEYDYLFSRTPTHVSRDIYGLEPFPESVEIARYIRERTGPTDRIAVIGSEPQIYYYAGRRAATGFNQMYGLMEQQPYALRMQQQMIDEVTAADPRFVVYVNATLSWMKRENSPQLIFDWADSFLAQRYRQVGVVDMVSYEKTEYRFGNDAKGYVPRSPVHLLIYERLAR